MLDHFFVGIVETVVAQRAAFEAFDQLGAVGAGKMENFPHANRVLEHLGLVDIAGNPVEHEEIVIGMEGVGFDTLVDADFPQLDRDFIGDEFSPARIFEELLAERGPQVERPEDIAAGAMVITGNSAQHAALRSFAAAGCAENEIGLVFAHGLREFRKMGFYASQAN